MPPHAIPECPPERVQQCTTLFGQLQDGQEKIAANVELIKTAMTGTLDGRVRGIVGEVHELQEWRDRWNESMRVRRNRAWDVVLRLIPYVITFVSGVAVSCYAATKVVVSYLAAIGNVK